MSILVDDKPYQSTGPAEQTVRELAWEVCGRDGGAERLVVSVRCDGEAVSDAELDAVLDTPSSRYGRVELQTQPTAALVRATLAQTIDLFKEASVVREEIADHLTAARHDQAMEGLRQFIGIFQQVQQSTLASARALGLDLESLESEGVRLADVIGEFRDLLVAMRDAMQAGDFVVLADTLRYDLEAASNAWLGCLTELRDAAAAA